MIRSPMQFISGGRAVSRNRQNRKKYYFSFLFSYYLKDGERGAKIDIRNIHHFHKKHAPSCTRTHTPMYMHIHPYTHHLQTHTQLRFAFF